MLILIAPDSFKDCLPADEVAAAIAEGVRRVRPEARIDLCPMADGGPGTVEAMVRAAGGRLVEVEVADPLRRWRKAAFGLLPGEPAAAVIEMAAAAGLELLAAHERNPMRTTTYGVGQLITAALDAGARRLIIGIGGSATTDGGAGCAQALGVLLLDRHGHALCCGVTGGDLASIARIDAGERDERLAQAELLVACDVTNPLLGPRGAAAVFGPQKGATPEMVARLEAGLANLAAVIERDLAVPVAEMPGGGAAGGLGAGLVAFAGAQLRRGVEIVADAVGLRRRLAGADLVITGEGRFDGQSAGGKTAVGVAQLATQCCVPAMCICGQATPDAPTELFARVLPLVGPDATLEQALAYPRELLARRAEEALASGDS